jgi:hypothetical protein
LYNWLITGQKSYIGQTLAADIASFFHDSTLYIFNNDSNIKILNLMHLPITLSKNKGFNRRNFNVLYNRFNSMIQNKNRLILTMSPYWKGDPNDSTWKKQNNPIISILDLNKNSTTNLPVYYPKEYNQYYHSDFNYAIISNSLEENSFLFSFPITANIYKYNLENNIIEIKHISSNYLNKVLPLQNSGLKSLANTNACEISSGPNYQYAHFGDLYADTYRRKYYRLICTVPHPDSSYYSSKVFDFSIQILDENLSLLSETLLPTEIRTGSLPPKVFPTDAGLWITKPYNRGEKENTLYLYEFRLVHELSNSTKIKPAPAYKPTNIETEKYFIEELYKRKVINKTEKKNIILYLNSDTYCRGCFDELLSIFDTIIIPPSSATQLKMFVAGAPDRITEQKLNKSKKVSDIFTCLSIENSTGHLFPPGTWLYFIDNNKINYRLQIIPSKLKIIATAIQLYLQGEYEALEELIK